MRSTILDVQDLCEDMYNEVISSIIVKKEQFASVIMLNFILTLLITFFEKMPYWSNLINLKKTYQNWPFNFRLNALNVFWFRLSISCHFIFLNVIFHGSLSWFSKTKGFLQKDWLVLWVLFCSIFNLLLNEFHERQPAKSRPIRLNLAALF